MNIFDVLNFCRLNQLDEGAVTINDIRRGMLGKGHEYRISKNSRRWYDKNKNDLLDLLSDIVKSDNKMVKQKMQKFDTDPYFELDDDNKRALKADKFMNAVEYAFSSNIIADEHSKNKSVGLSDQYEKIVLDNGVEIYAVYTPTANIQLAHSVLQKQGDPTPTWCIASPTSAFQMWGQYKLYEAEAPSVFIVYKKGEPKKYELKANPYKSLNFKNKKIRLAQFIDEWRDPLQNEEKVDETSLFDVMGISLITLENAIRHLMNTKKAETFSEKYGSEMLSGLETNMLHLTGKERILALTKLAKDGVLYKFFKYVNPDEHEYFLNELIRYNTLTDEYCYCFDDDQLERTVNYLVKEKKAGIGCLNYARKQGFDSFKKMLQLVTPETYTIAPHGCRDDKELEAIYKVAASAKMINGDFISGLTESDKVFFIRHRDEIINKAIEDKTLDGKFIATLIFRRLEDDIDTRKMFNLCKIALESHSGINLMFFALQRSTGYKATVAPKLAKLYLESEKINSDVVWKLPKRLITKGLYKLIKQKKYSWRMLTDESGLEETIKDKILKDIVRYTKLGYITLDGEMLDTLKNTKYIQAAAKTYIAITPSISASSMVTFLELSDHIKQADLIKLVKSIDYTDKEAQMYSSKILSQYDMCPRVVTIYIKNILNACSDNIDFCDAMVREISDDRYKGTELYKIATKYLNNRKGINPTEVLDKVLEFIDKTSHQITNELRAQFSPGQMLAFTVLYHDINASFDPDFEFISDPRTMVDELDEDDLLRDRWNELIDKLSNINFVNIDKDELDEYCRKLFFRVGSTIVSQYQWASGRVDLGVKAGWEEKVDFLQSDTHYDFNPYLRCCAKIIQKLNKTIDRNQTTSLV